MKRIIAMAALLIAVGAGAVFTSGSGNGGTYRVRAIFNNAFSVIPGEDVKIAGVKVGAIDSLDVTPDQKAAVVLRIDRAGFQDFRKDAECTIRPQSLIGEKFVECTPTQPRPAGQAAAPPLEKIASGPGKGQYLLPASQTSRPIDIDLINNVMRLPVRQRLTIVLNELGTGLAARGDDLRQLIRNADPALRETDKVLTIIGDQNRVLADLARNSDAIMAPLARERQHVAGFVDKANTTAQATAERRTQFEQNLQKLPAFLRQLEPTMQRLGGLSDQMTPVLSDLGRQAPAINRFIQQLGPFSAAGTPALTTLGEASVPGREALTKAKPIVGDLKDFAATSKPLSANLKALTESLRDTGGIERLMDYLFFQIAAINGFDSIGHYLRAELILNPCSDYAAKPVGGCSANFQGGASSGSSRSATAQAAAGGKRSDPTLDALARFFAGLDPKTGTPRGGGTKAKRGSAKARRTGGRGSGALQLPSAFLPSDPGAGSSGSSGPGAASQQPSTAPQGSGDGSAGGSGAGSGAGSGGGSAPAGDSSSGQQDPQQGLLDYLLGGGR